MRRARCRGTRLFRNQAIWNDLPWTQAGNEHTYSGLRGQLPAGLIALFKIQWVYMQHDMLCRLARVQGLRVVDSGRPSDTHGLVTVQLRDVTRELTIVNIGTILGLAYLIPEIDQRWLVNSPIDLRTFNEIY